MTERRDRELCGLVVPDSPQRACDVGYQREVDIKKPGA